MYIFGKQVFCIKKQIKLISYTNENYISPSYTNLYAMFNPKFYLKENYYKNCE